MRYRKEMLVGFLALIGLALNIWRPTALSPDQAATLAIVLVVLSLWATALWPPFLTAMAFFAALLIPGLADQELVFSGFSSAAMWLVVSGYVIGAAINSSGLGQRLAGLAAPHLSRSYPMLIGGLMAVGTMLCFLMPASTSRAMLLVPLGMAMADSLGLRPGTKGRTGVAVTVAVASNMPGFTVLPSNLPNMVLTGVVDRIYGIHFGYADYLILHFPVLGLLKSIMFVILILRFFPVAVTPATPSGDDSGESPARQRLLLTMLLVTLALWATDGIHGINPAWIGLALSVLLLWPNYGFVSVAKFRETADVGQMLLVAGVLAIGTVVSASGLGQVLANLATSYLPLVPERDFTNFASLSALAALTSLITTMPGVPAVLTPLAEGLAARSGLPLETVMMTQVIGFSTVIFPYQAAPILIAMGLAKEPPGAMFKVLLSMAALTFVLLVPLDFLWWKLLGWL